MHDTSAKGSVFLKIFYPLVALVLVVTSWAFLVWFFDVPRYVMPSPFDVAHHISEDWQTLVKGFGVTFLEFVLGFTLGAGTGFIFAVLMDMSRTVRGILYPILILSQAIPIIAISAALTIWLGFGLESKVLLTVLMTFFPLLLASISGFQILDPRLLYLTQSMGASSWQTFRYLRVPSALPVIFSGIKTSATIAATAAIVAEFVGANKGLGFVLLRATGTMDIELVFAVLVVLTVIGIVINYAVEFSEWAMTPWQRASLG